MPDPRNNPTNPSHRPPSPPRTQPIYLDYNATTPIDPRVAEAMEPYLHERFGNPSSAHPYGQQARAAVQKAREQVARLIGAQPAEIVFTSGGSEANNLAIWGAAEQRRAQGRHLITSAVEHPAVREPCRALEARGWEVTVLPVDGRGRVEPAALERALRPDTTLVTIMHAQNEVGTVQPIAELAALTGPRGIWLHTDAAQSVGKIPVDVDALGADLLSIAGHKFYGPKGVGALYVRAGRELPKLIHGAAHENNRRAGTENVLGLVGLGHAAHLSAAQLAEDMRHSRALRDRLRHRLQDHLQRHLRELAVPAERFAELPVHGVPDAPDPPGGLPNTLSVAFPGVDAAALLAELGPQVAASAGAACHADGVRLSPVLEALQVPPPVAMGTVRLSVGRPTTEAEVDEAAALIAAAVARRIPRMG